MFSCEFREIFRTPFFTEHLCWLPLITFGNYLYDYDYDLQISFRWLSNHHHFIWVSVIIFLKLLTTYNILWDSSRLCYNTLYNEKMKVIFLPIKISLNAQNIESRHNISGWMSSIKSFLCCWAKTCTEMRAFKFPYGVVQSVCNQFFIYSYSWLSFWLPIKSWKAPYFKPCCKAPYYKPEGKNWAE